MPLAKKRTEAKQIAHTRINVERLDQTEKIDLIRELLKNTVQYCEDKVFFKIVEEEYEYADWNENEELEFSKKKGRFIEIVNNLPTNYFEQLLLREAKRKNLEVSDLTDQEKDHLIAIGVFSKLITYGEDSKDANFHEGMTTMLLSRCVLEVGGNQTFKNGEPKGFVWKNNTDLTIYPKDHPRPYYRFLESSSHEIESNEGEAIAKVHPREKFPKIEELKPTWRWRIYDEEVCDMIFDILNEEFIISNEIKIGFQALGASKFTYLNLSKQIFDYKELSKYNFR